MIVYIIFISIFLFVIIVYFKYKLLSTNRNNNTIAQKQKTIEQINLKQERDLLFLKNKKMMLDAEQKDKELATSNRCVLQKNELLKNIKNQLQNSGYKFFIPTVKAIEKNLNKTDDWVVFEKIFANTDKDFIKNIRAIHPFLTPNDLRLCIYLKLNLSSKEIAPLLYISPKSVEVKRYRLRKKMNLSNSQNLVDYILGL